MKVSNATAKRRLLKLADLLESLPEGRFNFNHWGNVTRGKTGDDALENPELCGTTACALGWAPSLPFAKKLGVKLEVYNADGYTTAHFTIRGKRVRPHTVAKLLFGLSTKAMTPIFLGGPLTGNGARGEVAEGIREFVAIRFG